MSLSVGDRLGRFEVLSCLGVGGMGEVYRARDPQLQREVAIKVLPPEFSRDPERQRRFEQEARAAGGLNHPNILAVHDVGVHDGATWIVTELLEGATLRDRMDGRPLSPRTAVGYAVQIASGLAAAHERGLVHRDIKPANLFVTRDGRIKILDFGLAKLVGSHATGDGTETVTVGGVQLVPVMGTVGYMSPEQARGLRIDHRSDIFSFGTVLHEMLAGVPPFRRATTADTLSAILNEEPPDLDEGARIPESLKRLVRHCLEKEPGARFQSARDLVFNLESLQHSTGSAPAAAPRQRPRMRTLIRAGAGLLVVTGVALLGYLTGTRQAPAPSSAMTPHRVQRVTDFPGLEEFPSISPDRKQVAFTARVNGTRQIFVRLLAGGTPIPITKEAVDHQFPRWTPDSNSLVYFTPNEEPGGQGAIWSIASVGGSPRRLLASFGGADVSRQGRVACVSLVDGRLHLVTSALDGSDPRSIARLEAGNHQYPRWSPDSQWIAFQRGDGVRADIFVVPSRGGETRQLTHDRNVINGLAWLPDSAGLIYGSGRGSTIPYIPPLSLWEVTLDGRAPRLMTSPEVSYEQPDVHVTGVVAAGRRRIQFDLWSFPFGPSAKENVRRGTAVTRQTGQVMTPTVAPDGNQVAFLSDSGGHANLWVLSRSTGELRQITFEDDPSAAVGAAVWSPVGGTIAFVSSKDLPGLEFGVWLVSSDGTNLRNVARPGLGMGWSPDGEWLYYSDIRARAFKKVRVSGGAPVTVRSELGRNVIGVTGTTLYFMVEGQLIDGRPDYEIRAATPEDGPSRLVARIPASRVASWQVLNPALSPDGQWLALPLTDGHTTNVWALSTATGEWRQVTDFGDRATFIARRVSWSPDGKFIFAAVGEGDTDIVLLDGLVRPR